MIDLMKKIFSILASSVLFLTLTVPAFAQDTTVDICGSTTGAKQFNALCLFSNTSFGKIVGTVLTFLFVIAIVVALGYLIYGGIKWIISEGDKTQVEAARSHIVAALIGLVIVFLAYFIINVVLGFFVPGVNINNLKLPSL